MAYFSQLSHLGGKIYIHRIILRLRNIYIVIKFKLGYNYYNRFYRGGLSVKHHYSIIDNIHTTFSDIYASETKGESIIVYMERPTENDFDHAEFILPSITCTKCMGFTEDELLKLSVSLKQSYPDFGGSTRK